jgi:ElaB/YqjD/DUF883 family membrane-anchored ribosome-binding protein
MKTSSPEQNNAFDEIGTAARAARNPVQDAVDSARTDILGRIDSLTSTVMEAGKNAKDAGVRGVDATHRYVQSSPWQALGIAAVLGFLAGAVVRRR